MFNYSGGMGARATKNGLSATCYPTGVSAVPVEVLAVFPDGPPVRFVWEAVEWRVAHWWGPERIETGWWRG